MNNPCFIADVHLGKLARLLRLLGCDVLYQNDYSNEDLVRLAASENRVLLSRNAGFKKHRAIQFFHVSGEVPLVQLRQVIHHFQLEEYVHPFSRCLVCNGKLNAVKKEDIIDKLEPQTARYFREFWQCEACGRIYWKGSHYERMLGVIETLRGM